MISHRNAVNFFTGMDQRIDGEGPGVWLAVTSISFDISVLELLWTLSHGFRVVIYKEEHPGASRFDGSRGRSKKIDFSLFYFASDAGQDAGNRYRLLLEGARFADQNGFDAVWTTTVPAGLAKAAELPRSTIANLESGEGNPSLAVLVKVARALAVPIDELLAGQLALALVRAQLRRPAGDRNSGDGHLRKKIIDALPYSLTISQQQAAAAITDDLRQPVRMLRLLQGDVGSGKTVVALLAAAAVAEVGKQAALMAPTEILARQHIKTITPLAERAGLRVAILTGREKGKERRDILGRLEAGEIDLLVGTHALIQDDVVFKALALAVVDEQHRFGVRERLALTAKGRDVDVLVLSATPIPRTLVLTYFGDMDVSELREKPAGRQPIDTRAVASSRINEVMEAVGRALDKGKLVYWIVPLVEESETVNLTDAEARFESLRERFGDKVGLVHGKMRGTDKDRAMAQFAAGETGLLVATTVVEVGVDVPAATIMVIENAERFGLAQLHQLRGRIGRGSEASTCLLLYKEPLGEMSTARLKVIRETTDGFRIAEEDLKLRGEGDVLGVRQSGLPGYRIARTDVHGQLITQARDEALRIMKDNPKLEGARGEALRALLYLFERDEALPLIGAG